MVNRVLMLVAMQRAVTLPYVTMNNVLRARVRGVPRSLDRFSQYGIKVSFGGSGTLKIEIYVENYPQKRSFRLADYHPLWVGGVN